jgi:hypothetical protein
MMIISFKVGIAEDEHIIVSDMKKDMAYEFKITARNRAGHGPPYCPEEPVVAGRKKSMCNSSYLLSFILAIRAHLTNWGPNCHHFLYDLKIEINARKLIRVLLCFD